MKTQTNKTARLWLFRTGTAFLLALTAGYSAWGAESPRPATKVSSRKGVFNTRSVALAFYRSELWVAVLKEKRAEMEQAKAKGDTEKVKELETWGKGNQDNAHRQVFGDAPIDGVLTHMTELLRQVKDQANVTELMPIRGTNVPPGTVDLTDAVVRALKPTPQTLKMVEDMKKHPPLSADQFPLKD